MAVSRSRRASLRKLALGAFAAALVLGAAGSGSSASAAIGSDPFRANEVYRGDFPDPSLLRVGETYYAYSTNTGGNHLPSMTSKDLRTWTARPPHASGHWWDNDAMPRVASWAAKKWVRGEWRSGTWAPSVAKVGNGYVAAYVAQRSYVPAKQCISIATSRSPLGPFVDRSTAPIVCRRDLQGSIDPQVFVNGNGAPFLLWKNEGIPGREPTRIWVRRLTSNGDAFVRGSRAHNLLTTAQRWEGNVVENPAMIQYAGRYYLFYSGNLWFTSSYATGYAICSGPLGPCKRPGRTPLLATGGAIAGPGGATPVVTRGGVLRLGYAAWDRGRVGYPATSLCQSTAAGCNQRKLHVARLAVGRGGRLSVVARG